MNHGLDLSKTPPVFPGVLNICSDFHVNVRHFFVVYGGSATALTESSMV